jgi:hypothetical protein
MGHRMGSTWTDCVPAAVPPLPQVRPPVGPGHGGGAAEAGGPQRPRELGCVQPRRRTAGLGQRRQVGPCVAPTPLQNRKTQNTGVRGTAGGPESTVAAAEGGRCLGLSILRVLSVV